MQLAFLLSSAVQRGFNNSWLSSAQKLLNYFLESSAYDRSTGVISHLYLDDDGTPLDDGPVQSWIYGETLRTLLHFALVRNRVECITFFNLTYFYVYTNLRDLVYDGWYPSINTTNNNITANYKGSIWKVGYQEINFYHQALMLVLPVGNTGSSTPQWAVTLAASLSALVFLGILFGIAYLNWKVKPNTRAYKRLKDDREAAALYGTVTNRSISEQRPPNVLKNYSKSESRRDDIFGHDIMSTDGESDGEKMPSTRT